jgi:hypothetical protein
MYLKEFEICCDRLEQESLKIDEFYIRHCEEARKSEHMKKISISLKQKQEQKTNTIQEFADLIDKHLHTAHSKSRF